MILAYFEYICLDEATFFRWIFKQIIRKPVVDLMFIASLRLMMSRVTLPW